MNLTTKHLNNLLVVVFAVIMILGAIFAILEKPLATTIIFFVGMVPLVSLSYVIDRRNLRSDEARHDGWQRGIGIVSLLVGVVSILIGGVLLIISPDRSLNPLFMIAVLMLMLGWTFLRGIDSIRNQEGR